MESSAYITLSGICKSFGAVTANHNINFSIRKGEIHALLGENGSGKSTLVNMLSGIYTPDSGSIVIGGRSVRFNDPGEAIAAGIGMVHQHFKLVEVLSARDNIVLGLSGKHRRGKALNDEIYAVSKKYGLLINPDQKIYTMSVGEKQAVEIVKVLFRGATTLILDEPTAVLTPQETRTLFSILRNMKNEGCAIIIITHKLGEVLEISDRVTVLRKGETIGTVTTGETNARALTEMMVGRSISLAIQRPAVDESLRTPLLTVRSLCVKAPLGTLALDHVSFTLSAGEILGFAGIAGSGQRELCEAIAGLEKTCGGDIIFQGESIIGQSPRHIIRRGISMSFIPEDRLGMGLVGGMDIVDNVLLKTYQNTPGLVVDRKGGEAAAAHIINKFDISTPGVHQQVKKLSGGNIQKVLLGREIQLNPHLLITAYPVRGLDINASYNIYDALNEQKRKGVGILFIGEDLDVLLELCDRIAVLHGGRLMGIYDAPQLQKEDLGLLMLGHRLDSEDHAAAKEG